MPAQSRGRAKGKKEAAMVAGGRTPTLSGRYSLPVALGGLLLLVSTVAALWLFFLEDCKDALRGAERQATALAVALEAQAAAAFGEADIALSGVISLLQRVGPGDEDAIHRFMAQEMARRAFLRDLVVADGDGRLRVHGRQHPPVRFDLSDRDYVAAHRERQIDLYVGAPFQGRLTGQTAFAISRRLPSESGFAGVAAATVDPELFRSFYSQLELGEGGLAALATADGRTIAAVGWTDAASPCPPNGGVAGAFRGSDGVERVLAVGRPANAPVQVCVGYAVATIHAEWLAQHLPQLVEIGVLLLLLAGLTVFALLQVERRAAAQRRLAANETRLRAFAESASDWFWETDMEQRLVYTSGSSPLEVPDWPFPPILGRQRSEYLAEIGVDPSVWQQVQAWMDAGETFRDHVYHAVVPGRGTMWISLSGQPTHDDSGRIVGYRGTSREITQQRRTEDALRQSQRLEALGQLTGGIAHDFNNLLTVIVGNAEMLEQALIGNRRLWGLAAMVREAAERGSDLTHRLLAFGRRQALRPVPLDLAQVLRGMLPLIRRTMREDMDVRLVADETLPPTELDRGEFESALLNLVINARDAMPDGGRLTIEATAVDLDDEAAAAYGELAAGRYVTVTVSDSGVGIPAGALQHVFEPFYTTKAPGRGTGLGLSMVYGFVRQSGGEARIDSAVGLGTTVKLLFPVVAVRPTAIVLDPQPATLRGSGETVLLVEDDPLVRAAGSRMLNDLGYQVREAGDASEALAILQAGETVDLMLTDMVLPGGRNGRQLVEMALKRRPGLRILYTSGYAQNTGASGRLEDGSELLAKPYSRAGLSLALRRTLER